MLVAISLLSSAFARWSCHVSRMRLLSDYSQTGLLTDYGSGAGLSTLRAGTKLALYPSRAVGPGCRTSDRRAAGGERLRSRPSAEHRPRRVPVRSRSAVLEEPAWSPAREPVAVASPVVRPAIGHREEVRLRGGVVGAGHVDREVRDVMPDERLRGRRCQPLPGLQEELTDGCTAPGGRAVPRLENAILDEQVDQPVAPPPLAGVRAAPPRPAPPPAPRPPPKLRAPPSVPPPPLYHLGLGYKRRAIPLAMRPRLATPPARRPFVSHRHADRPRRRRTGASFGGSRTRRAESPRSAPRASPPRRRRAAPRAVHRG